MVRFTVLAAFAAVLGVSLSLPLVRQVMMSPEAFLTEATPVRTPGASFIPPPPAGLTPGASVIPKPSTAVTPGASQVPQPSITPGASRIPQASASIPQASASIAPVPVPPTVPTTGNRSTAALPSGSAPTPSFSVSVADPAGLSEPFSVTDASPVAVVSPSPGATDPGAVCFPAHAVVELENGSFKTMEEVQLGDRVKVSSGLFSDVFMFTHKLSNVEHEFVSIKSTSGADLSLTAGHYLYVNGDLVPAKTVKKGDSLDLGNGSVTIVASVEKVLARGLFNPQTTHGDIIVNGIRASTYTTAIVPDAAHALLAPMRSLYERFGLTSGLLDAGSARLASMVANVLSN